MKGKQCLSTGYVPCAEIVRVIDTALKMPADRYWEDDDERLSPLTQMWSIDDLKKQLGIVKTKGERKWIPFDMADVILCKLRISWHDYLPEIYHKVSLAGDHGSFAASHRVRTIPKGMRRCERSTCVNTFPYSKGGRYERKYCSENCKHIAWREKVGRSKRIEVKAIDSIGGSRCKAGHVRTEENTHYRKNGTRVCKVCRRIAESRRRERKAA